MHPEKEGWIWLLLLLRPHVEVSADFDGFFYDYFWRHDVPSL
jgi:hypothetical protein